MIQEFLSKKVKKLTSGSTALASGPSMTTAPPQIRPAFHLAGHPFTLGITSSSSNCELTRLRRTGSAQGIRRVRSNKASFPAEGWGMR